MAGFPSPTTYRPAVMGTHYVAATGHYLATMAAVRVLEQGGNAIDAGVAAGLCINVLLPDMTNLGGVAPIILYSARDRAVRTISGLGPWPRTVRREYFVEECAGTIPPGVARCVVPAAADAWLTALQEFGALSFAEVAAPAIALAEDGFPVYPFLHANLEAAVASLARWESTASIYLPGGAVPEVGRRLVQRDLGRTLRLLVEAEAGAAGQGRAAGIQAARDRFYRGDIAERIAGFVQQQGGFMTREDLAAFQVDVEEPVTVRYRGHEVCACGPWCQGPVALEALAILEAYDLTAMGHNSADALHHIVEALDAAFADRERYYGDPEHVDVPVEGLLDAAYAASWRDRIAAGSAFAGMPEPGDPWRFQRANAPTGVWHAPAAFDAPTEPDTSYVCVVDEQGNAFSATPSDGVTGTPIVPGLGIIVSSRGVQSWLDPEHPSAIAPGKRPRLTPSPGMVLKDGAVFAPYGTPGNDVQPQAMVQFLVNLLDFGMDPQAAIEAPRLASYNYPASTHPHPYTPNRVQVESRVPAEVLAELARRGHRVERWPDWSAPAGALCSVVVDRERGVLTGGADPRRVAYAIGW